jgi:hypothetical protein
MQDKKYGAKLRKEFYMKNLFKLIGIIALAAVIGFSFAACGDDDGTTGGNSGNGGNPGNGGGNSGLNGTWVNQAGEQWVFNNGSLTVNIDNVESIRGTYSTSGSNITITFTQIKGSTFGEDGAEMGLSPNQWYTKSQFRTAVINYAVSLGMTQAKAAELADELLEEEFPLFDPMTGPYTLSGNTLTIDGAVFTRQGDGTSGGGGGTGGSMTWTAVADKTVWFESTTTYQGTTYTSYYDITAVAYGGGRWVAGGEKGKMAYSDNGTSWTAVADSTFGTRSSDDVAAIAYGGGRWAAGCGGRMAHSSDGANWTAVTNSDPSSAIAYGAGKFVAVGGGMSYSTDGVSWTDVPNSTVWDYQGYGGRTYQASINGIAYGNNRFVAVGYQGKTAYSDDGINWTAAASSSAWEYQDDGETEVETINAVAYGSSNRWVAVGDWAWVGDHDSNGTMAYSTDNGVTWTAVPAGGRFDTAGSIAAIAFGNGRFVAGSYNGKTAYSSDGASWTTVADSKFGSSIIFGIAYGNGRFVAVGGDGKMAYCDW